MPIKSLKIGASRMNKVTRVIGSIVLTIVLLSIPVMLGASSKWDAFVQWLLICGCLLEGIVLSLLIYNSGD